MGFIVKLVLVLAVVAGGTWVWVVTHPGSIAVTQEASEVTPKDAAQANPVAENTGIRAVSDASLNADLQAFDAHAQEAAKEQATVESSFTDKPIQQTE